MHFLLEQLIYFDACEKLHENWQNPPLKKYTAAYKLNCLVITCNRFFYKTLIFFTRNDSDHSAEREKIVKSTPIP